jgi:hypothetical protein
LPERAAQYRFSQSRSSAEKQDLRGNISELLGKSQKKNPHFDGEVTVVTGQIGTRQVGDILWYPPGDLNGTGLADDRWCSSVILSLLL